MSIFTSLTCGLAQWTCTHPCKIRQECRYCIWAVAHMRESHACMLCKHACMYYMWLVCVWPLHGCEHGITYMYYVWVVSVWPLHGCEHGITYMYYVWVVSVWTLHMWAWQCMLCNIHVLCVSCVCMSVSMACMYASYVCMNVCFMYVSIYVRMACVHTCVSWRY